jgi:hypothetical protein
LILFDFDLALSKGKISLLKQISKNKLLFSHQGLSGVKVGGRDGELMKDAVGPIDVDG